MAWTCSAATNGALVSNLHREGLATSAMVVAALQQVDRRWFVPEALSDVAYDDRPLPIGYGATISAPHMHAMMLDLIAPVVSRWRESTSHARNSTTTARPMRILDVGSGSGFLTAALAVMCQDARSSGTWTVHGIEHIPELQQRAQRAFESHFADRGWFTPGCEHVKLVVGDGRDPAATPGLHAEYDVIHVGAAAAHVPPVYEQLLAPGGCLVIPVGPENGTQRLLVLSKRADGSVGQTENSLVRFVPLTSSTHQLRHV